MTTSLAEEIRDQVLKTKDRTVPSLRRFRRDASRRLKSLKSAEVNRLALALLSNPQVPRWFAFELVHHHRDAMADLSLSQLRKLGRGLSAWHEVDPFACYLSGPAWRDGLISDEDVHRWAKSTDRWWRRVAVVSSVALNNTARGGRGDVKRTLAVCELVKTDRHDMVVKALSWALRELARKHPNAVREYLHANKSVLAARVVREVGNKLRTGLKNPGKAF